MQQSAVAAELHALASDASIEVTPRSLAGAAPPARLQAAGTSVYVPFLPRAHFEDTVAACRRLAREGVRPVPHLAARAVPSRPDLADWLGRLADIGVDSLFLIAGDVRVPHGPFSDTLGILESGQLQRHGFLRVGIAGYPEGHPAIDAAALHQALAQKAKYARDTGTDMWLVTQFAFEAKPVVAWLRAVRDGGIALPVRVGVPAPGKLQTLLGFALQCGVGASAKALIRRPVSGRKLAGRWTPDDLLVDLARHRLADPTIPMVGIHLFPFGGVRQGTEWLGALRERAARPTEEDDELVDAATVSAVAAV